MLRHVTALFFGLAIVYSVQAQVQNQIVADLEQGFANVQGWELTCTVQTGDRKFSGDCTVGFHEGANFIKKTVMHTTKAGLTHKMTYGYLGSDGKVYAFNYADDYKSIPGVGSIESNGFDAPSVLSAYEHQGVRYSELARAASAIAGSGSHKTLTGVREGHPFRIVVQHFPFGWRVVELQVEYRVSKIDLRFEATLEGWTNSKGVTLPEHGTMKIRSVNPANQGRRAEGLPPNGFQCDFSTLRPSTKLTLQDVFRPGTFVVAGPYKLLQMTESGELVDGSGLLKKPFLPWNIAYVLSVAGLVFFSSLWFWQYKRRTAGSRR